MASGTRPPAVAGSFYPLEKSALVFILKQFFNKTKTVCKDKKIKALIVPHAGYRYSGQVAAWGYCQLPKNLKNQLFVLIGPSHCFLFEGMATNNFSYWETPLGRINHQPLVKNTDQIFLNDRLHIPEHSIEVQLPFLQFLYDSDFSISCFLTGQFKLISEVFWVGEYFLKNYPSAIFIISSDLCHYLPEDRVREIDKKTVNSVLKLDYDYFLLKENVACGTMGILILMAMAKKANWKRRLIYYNTSFTASRDKTAVVGYPAIIFYD